MMSEQKMSEQMDNQAQGYASTQGAQGTCPCCGYCSHCGRGFNPPYQPYVYPYWFQPQITSVWGIGESYPPNSITITGGLGQLSYTTSVGLGDTNVVGGLQ